MLNTRAIAFKQQPVIGLCVATLGVILAWEIGGWIVAGNLVQMAYLAVAIAMAVVALGILGNWRSGVYMFLIWLVFEDLIRKYLGNNMAIFFAKDVLAALIYISFIRAIRKHHEKAFRPPFLLAISLFFWWAVLQIFNPYSPSTLYGALGLKIYFFYAPLMFVGYALVRNDQDLRRFLTVVLSVAAVVAGLGIIQAVVGPQFLNPATLAPEIRELGALDKVTPLTQQILHLPSSVFVSTGRYSQYLFCSFVLGLGAAGYLLLQGGRGRRFVYISLGLVAVGVLFSGTRGPLILSVCSAGVMSLAFLWGAPWRNRQVHRVLKGVRHSVIVMGMCLALAALVVPGEVGKRWNFYSETLSPSSSAYELSTRVWDYPVHELMLAFSEPQWAVGHGTGTASLGMQYVARLLGQRQPQFAVENGYGTILVEFGIVGLILWLICTAAVVISCWRVVLKLRETRMFPIGFAVFWFALVLLFPQTYGTLNVYQDYVQNAMLWLLVGIAFRLPELIESQPAASTAHAAKLRPSLAASSGRSICHVRGRWNYGTEPIRVAGYFCGTDDRCTLSSRTR